MFSILYSLLCGIYLAFAYFLEFQFLKQQASSLAYKILDYFIFLFILLPFGLTLIIVFLVSFLYKRNKIKVNSNFHILLKKMYAISFFINSSTYPFIFKFYYLSNHNFIFLIIYLLLSLFFLILYTLCWVNILHQIECFIEQKIPKKCEWILVYFLFYSFIGIFAEILDMIMNIVNYLLTKENKRR
ncbi:MAG: Bax inhibitor-1/YccA family protein [Vigna little leaf phytoplasma]|nr:Bax inhibitor-1/YccA family protein [Vigna little leaf phytoplasma]